MDFAQTHLSCLKVSFHLWVLSFILSCRMNSNVHGLSDEPVFQSESSSSTTAVSFATSFILNRLRCTRHFQYFVMHRLSVYGNNNTDTYTYKYINTDTHVDEHAYMYNSLLCKKLHVHTNVHIQPVNQIMYENRKCVLQRNVNVYVHCVYLCDVLKVETLTWTPASSCPPYFC